MRTKNQQRITTHARHPWRAQTKAYSTLNLVRARYAADADTPLPMLLGHSLPLRGSRRPSVFHSSSLQSRPPNQCPSVFICGSFPFSVRRRYRTGNVDAHKSTEIDRSKPKGDHRCGDSSAPRWAGRRTNNGDRAMELLASSNREGPPKCFKSNVNVDRLCGKPVALVAAAITVLLTTGCVTLDAPPSSIGLAADEPVHIANVGDPLLAFISAANVRVSNTRQTLFEPRSPLVANQAMLVPDNGAWLFGSNDGVVAPLLSTAIDSAPIGIDPHFWESQTDLRLEFESELAVVMEPAEELAGLPGVPVVVQPVLAAPVGTLPSPVASSMESISRQDLWQSVMKATAVGFLAFVLLVPMGCSFVAGVVCGQPRASPKPKPKRHWGRRRESGQLFVGLRHAIANVPAH